VCERENSSKIRFIIAWPPTGPRVDKRGITVRNKSIPRAPRIEICKRPHEYSAARLLAIPCLHFSFLSDAKLAASSSDRVPIIAQRSRLRVASHRPFSPARGASSFSGWSVARIARPAIVPRSETSRVSSCRAKDTSRSNATREITITHLADTPDHCFIVPPSLFLSLSLSFSRSASLFLRPRLFRIAALRGVGERAFKIQVQSALTANRKFRSRDGLRVT